MSRADEAAAKFGRAVFGALFTEFVEGGWEVEIGDFITGDAVKAGLVEKVAFDPEAHEDNEGCAEPGDDWFQLTELGKQVRP